MDFSPWIRTWDKLKSYLKSWFISFKRPAPQSTTRQNNFEICTRKNQICVPNWRNATTAIRTISDDSDQDDQDSIQRWSWTMLQQGSQESSRTHTLIRQAQKRFQKPSSANFNNAHIEFPYKTHPKIAHLHDALFAFTITNESLTSFVKTCSTCCCRNSPLEVHLRND